MKEEIERVLKKTLEGIQSIDTDIEKTYKKYNENIEKKEVTINGYKRKKGKRKKGKGKKKKPTYIILVKVKITSKKQKGFFNFLKRGLADLVPKPSLPYAVVTLEENWEPKNKEDIRRLLKSLANGKTPSEAETNLNTAIQDVEKKEVTLDNLFEVAKEIADETAKTKQKEKPKKKEKKKSGRRWGF